jgi:hypothetical protein
LDSLGVDSYGVGITTLEEVFLRIGHGEQEDSPDASPVRQAEKLALEAEKLSAEERELEDYTSEFAESSTFFDHTATITMKKVRMQIRDMKTLLIDTLFPALLIVLGMGAATAAIFDAAAPLSMTPALFP